MRSVTLTVVSIVLFAFISNTVSALPVAPSHLADGKVDAAAKVAAKDPASSIQKRGGLFDTIPIVGPTLDNLLGKDKFSGAAKNSASSIQKGVPGSLPVLGNLIGSKPKNDGNTAQAAGSTGSEETKA